MEEIKVITRDFDPPKDEALVYSTWKNGSYYSSLKNPDESTFKFFPKKTQEIKAILETAKVNIACLSDSPETIIGYSVSRGTHLDWIYVKPEYRLQGIAKLLLPKNIDTYTSDLTFTGSKIVKKKKLKLKENEDGRTENRQTDQGIQVSH